MYRKKTKGWLKHIDFMLFDLVCLDISFVIAYIIRHGYHNMYDNEIYRYLAVTLLVIDVIAMIFFESLKNVLKRGYYKELIVTIKHVCIVELMTTFYLFVMQSGDKYSRITILLNGFIYLIISYVVRSIWKSLLKKKMLCGSSRSLLIITEKNMVDLVIDNIKKNNYELFILVGIVIDDINMVGASIDGIPIVANHKTVKDYVCKNWIDEVFIDLSMESPYPKELIDAFTEMGVVVHMKLARTLSNSAYKQFVERMGNYTVLTTSINYASTGELFAKRSLDILGGIVGCMLAGIAFIIIAPIVYIKSRGPVLFTQVRVGKNGKLFKLYKFRSMYMDAEARKKELMGQNRVSGGMMFKLDWDPRIIGSKKLPDGTCKKGIGNIIRDYSIDELPQFFNVLKGDMSIVGTRPPTVDEWEKYELHHRARLATKPGVTGMWQVSGRSNITDFEEVVKLDKKYIAEWSLGLDIKLILKTIQVVFKGIGAM